MPLDQGAVALTVSRWPAFCSSKVIAQNTFAGRCHQLQLLQIWHGDGDVLMVHYLSRMENEAPSNWTALTRNFLFENIQKSGGPIMKKICVFFVYAAIAGALAGCGAATINPNYTSANPELMRIGGETPSNKGPEIINLGSYCLQVTDKWKTEGKTPDGQDIWTKDSFRKAIPCR